MFRIKFISRLATAAVLRIYHTAYGINMISYAVSVFEDGLMVKDSPSMDFAPSASDILTVTQFANVFPLDAVTRTLDSLGCGTIRVREATNERLVYFQLMLALFRECSYRAVYRTVQAALDQLESKEERANTPTAAALTQGLDRLKPKVFESLFHEFAVPAGQPGDRGIWFKNWRMVSIDGFTLATENTKPNRKYFEAPSNQHGSGGLPQLRCVCFVEVGSHLVFRAATGGYHDGEISLARHLLPLVQKDWILLADRNFYSFKFYKEVSEKGTALLFRLQRGMSLKSEQQLSDNSHIVTLYDAEDSKRESGLKARLIEYDVIGTKKKKRETFYLITNILDTNLASADELGRLYRQRWEHENTLDEIKTHLNLSAITLRSKNPERVLQEFWALLMAHYSIRLLMYKAAIRGKIDPDRLSYTHTVNVVKDNVTRQHNAQCHGCGISKTPTEKNLLEKVLEERLPARRSRTRARGTRRREKFEPIKGKDKKTQKVDRRIKVRKGWSYNVPH